MCMIYERVYMYIRVSACTYIYMCAHTRNSVNKERKKKFKYINICVFFTFYTFRPNILYN